MAKPIPDEGSYRLPPSACPWCGRVNDLATDPRNNAVPSPGAASVCFNCLEFSIYDDDLLMRKPTADELITLSLDEDAQQIVEALRKVKERHA